MKWIRVTAKHPCPICKKKDWCCITEAGDLVLCMRVPNDRPSKGQAGGYLHQTASPDGGGSKIDKHHRREERRIPEQSASKLMRRWRLQTTTESVKQFAGDLGVSAYSLQRLGVAWCKARSCWAFPMKSPAGKVVGIRLRSKSEKKSVGGSKNALFYAADIQRREVAWLTEGPTDTAAMLTIGGRCVIGRSALTTCWDDLRVILLKLGVKRVIILVDDESSEGKEMEAPGRRENRRMAKAIGLPCKFISMPGCKDIRDYVKRGGRMKGIMACLREQKWMNP